MSGDTGDEGDENENEVIVLCRDTIYVDISRYNT